MGDCSATPAAVYVSILSELGHVGDNVTLQCRISGVPDIVPRVRWVKSPGGQVDAFAAVQQTIADGMQIVEPYHVLGRYYPTLTWLSQVTLYTLTIYCELALGK